MPRKNLSPIEQISNDLKPGDKVDIFFEDGTECTKRYRGMTKEESDLAEFYSFDYSKDVITHPYLHRIWLNTKTKLCIGWSKKAIGYEVIKRAEQRNEQSSP